MCIFYLQEGTVEVTPEGYLLKAFPFKGQSFYQTPPVAVIVSPSSSKAVTVQCFLVGEQLAVSDTYRASRAFGKLQFVVEP